MWWVLGWENKKPDSDKSRARQGMDFVFLIFGCLEEQRFITSWPSRRFAPCTFTTCLNGGGHDVAKIDGKIHELVNVESTHGVQAKFFGEAAAGYS